MIQLGERPIWQELAACHGKVDVFFPIGDRQVYSNIQKARKICASCPVREECLDYSLTLPHPWHGVYAGLTPKERRHLKGQNNDTIPL